MLPHPPGNRPLKAVTASKAKARAVKKKKGAAPKAFTPDRNLQISFHSGGGGGNNNNNSNNHQPAYVFGSPGGGGGGGGGGRRKSNRVVIASQQQLSAFIPSPPFNNGVRNGGGAGNKMTYVPPTRVVTAARGGGGGGNNGRMGPKDVRRVQSHTADRVVSEPPSGGTVWMKKEVRRISVYSWCTAYMLGVGMGFVQFVVAFYSQDNRRFGGFVLMGRLSSSTWFCLRWRGGGAPCRRSPTVAHQALGYASCRGECLNCRFPANMLCFGVPSYFARLD